MLNREETKGLLEDLHASLMKAEEICGQLNSQSELDITSISVDVENATFETQQLIESEFGDIV